MDITTMSGMLLSGFGTTLQIFVLTLVGSIPLAVPVALARMSKIRPLALLARVYISVMRGTPLMLQMFAIYFAPYYVFGIRLTPDSKWYACIFAFIINYAAYFAEIYRSGIQSIPRGQYEAAEVLGYTKVDVFPHRAAAGGQAHPAGYGQRSDHLGQGHIARLCDWCGRDVLDCQGTRRLSGEHDAVCHLRGVLLGLQLLG